MITIEKSFKVGVSTVRYTSVVSPEELVFTAKLIFAERYIGYGKDLYRALDKFWSILTERKIIPGRGSELYEIANWMAGRTELPESWLIAWYNYTFFDDFTARSITSVKEPEKYIAAAAEACSDYMNKIEQSEETFRSMGYFKFYNGDGLTPEIRTFVDSIITTRELRNKRVTDTDIFTIAAFAYNKGLEGKSLRKASKKNSKKGSTE